VHLEFLISFSWKRIVFTEKCAHFWILILAATTSPIHTGIAGRPEKEVRSEEDLPRMTYSINGSVSSLLQSDSAAFAPLLKKVVSDIHLLLTDYDIQDRATLISVLSAKLATQELNGEIVRSAAPDESGRALYTTRKHYRQTQGLGTRILSALSDKVA